MSEPPAENVPAEHVFTVTHYIRPAGNIGGWSQVTSAEGPAAAAHEFIEERQAEADRMALRPAVSAAAPPAATSADEPSQDVGQAASGQDNGTSDPRQVQL